MRTVAVVSLALALVCTVGSAQEGNVLLALDFDDDLSGFISLDPEATLSVTREADAVHGGAGSLQFEYFLRALNPEELAEGLPGAMALPLAEPMREFLGVSFALWTAMSTPVIVVVGEGEDGPRYNRVIWSEAGAWHEFAIGLDDFIHDEDSSEDPDGELTPEEINAIALLDAGGFIRFLAGETGLFYAEPPAHQVLRLDDLKLRSITPVRPAPAEGTVTLSDYEYPLQGIIILGGKQVVAGKEDVEGGGEALKLDYTVPEGTLMAVLHQVKPGTLAGVSAIRFRVRSAWETSLIISVEEKRGQREEDKSNYQALVSVAGEEAWQTVTVPISDLQLSEDDFDPDGKLDLELVEMITIGDMSGVMGPGDFQNTLWLDDLVAVE